MAPLLEVRGIDKAFGGIAALAGVSLAVEPAELVGLVGPNGAGKTTLFDCLLGAQPPDAGSVLLAGTPLGSLPPFARARLGIGRTFQRLELFPGTTPRDHLLLALRVRAGTGRLWKDLAGLGRPTQPEAAEADRLLDLVGLAALADVPVESLSLGHGRLVELARALATGPRLLLLDEPSSGLDAPDRRDLARLLRHVRDQAGTALVLVDHDLDLVRAATDRLLVLDAGRIVADGPPDRVLADPAVRRAYLGDRP